MIKNFFTKSGWKPVSIWLIAVVTLTLSYLLNITGTVSDERHQKFDLVSEQLVLDGILANSEKPRLGHYTRPQIGWQNFVYAHELYDKRDQSGHFIEYTAQYGLQIRFFNYLVSEWGVGIRGMKLFCSFMLALVITVICRQIYRHFSRASAIAFFLLFLLSPWIVLFSHNLYWVTFTWFIPIAIAFYFASRIQYDQKNLIIMSALLFIAFFVKFLCGYEFISTFSLASASPFVMIGMKNSQRFRLVFRNVVIVFLVSVAAFISALTVHVISLQKAGYDSQKIIFNIVSKRTVSGSPEETAQRIIDDSDPNESRERLEGRYKSILASLKASRTEVFAKYLHNDEMLPWLCRLRPYETDFGQARASIKEMKSLQFSQVMTVENSKMLIRMIPYLMNKATLVILIALAIYLTKSRISTDGIPLAFSFLAPLSWLVLAKSHCYAHTYMNHVIWYVFFIPVAIICIVEHTRCHCKRANGRSMPQIT